MANKLVKAVDLRAKTDKELETRLGDLRKEKFNLRFQKTTGQLTNTSRVGHVRKEIAQIMTILGEKLRMAGQQDKPAKKTVKKGK